MNPKFSVGEVVILQSVRQPECNGEASVLSVEVGERPLREASEMLDGVHYKLNVYGQHGNLWHESALRKKHQPGEHSFTGLMAALKNPVSV